MFLSYVNKKEEVHSIVIQDLRGFGIKYRQKKQKQHAQETASRKVFKRPLHSLPTETVTMQSGQQLIVPKLLHELCSFVLNKVHTEGLFRKGGSKARQNEIKLYIDAGCHLNDEHHVIDIASVLKTFFRDLPEPLLPHAYHEIFLRCMLLKERQLDALLLCCLLLPPEHLNTLTYFMQFLNEVTEYSEYNKMDSYNLSVVIGPTLLPLDEKLALVATERLSKTCQLFKLLIENAYQIGILPEDIINKLGIKSTDDVAPVPTGVKKNKKRSGSLTRMLNGLKKIVTNKTNEESPPKTLTTPDLLLTPCISQSGRKRKLESGFSSKKRNDLMHKLPQGSVLNAPYAPCRTPVSVDPNPKQHKSPQSVAKGSDDNEPKHAEKWYAKTKGKNSVKSASHVSLKKQWSVVSNHMTALKKGRKRSSMPAQSKPSEIVAETCASSQQENAKTSVNLEPDYVRVPKTEYEEIKNRVRAIERRLSLELDTAQTKTDVDEDPIEKVQDAYEKTLHEAQPLSPTTDHLARRFSRELKIRKSSETRVIRSPSARKIGSLRRKSRDSERQNAVARRQSWHVSSVDVGPKSCLKRGRPNTVKSGLRTPTKEVVDNQTTLAKKLEDSDGKCNKRSSSFNGTSAMKTKNSADREREKWTTANHFFNKLTPNGGLNLENARASIVKLRNQNAGMVLAKAKLFDGLQDSDSSTFSYEDNNSLPKAKPGSKIGNIRSSDRQVSRIRTLKADERKMSRKSVSPRKKTIPRHRLQVVKIPDEIPKDKENSVPDVIKSPICCNTPQNVPCIKKALSVKSPKRLHRTPMKIDYKRTPIKVSGKLFMSDC